MRKTSTFLFAAFLPVFAMAQGEPVTTGARFAGMGYAGVTMSDLWNVSGNQAGLAGLEHPVAGAYYQQHWLSPDLAMQGLAVAVPVGKGCFAASANSFGNDLYAQRTFGLAYAMKLSDDWRVGVQLDYLNLRLGEDYGSTGAVTAEVGVQAKITEHLWVGAHLYNPNRAKLGGPYDEEVPTVFKAGLGYVFNDKVVMTGDVSKDIDRPEQYHAGIEYQPVKALYLRTGISTGPTKAHFGAGLRIKQLELDIAAVLRSQLGLTPMLNLNYRFE